VGEPLVNDAGVGESDAQHLVRQLLEDDRLAFDLPMKKRERALTISRAQRVGAAANDA
jgi:hypothetical protein